MSDEYIKMEGEPSSFDGGAIRYTKNGKGRYDLIPPVIISDFINYVESNWCRQNLHMITADMDGNAEILKAAYGLDVPHMSDDNIPNEVYFRTIFEIVKWKYCLFKCNNGIYSFELEDFIQGVNRMLKDLAFHYEKGAEKYGVDNWKKGIPETKGERGGSFRDSGLRHLTQMISGLTDEPHTISAIWNFIGALYVKTKDEESLDERCETDPICRNLRDLQKDEDTSSDGLSVISFGKEIKMFYNNKNLIVETAKDGEITCDEYYTMSSIPKSVTFAEYVMKFTGTNELGQRYYIYLGRFSRESGLTIDISKADEPDSHLVGQVKIYQEDWVKINLALKNFIIKLRNNKPSSEVKRLTPVPEPMVFIREGTLMQTCVLKLNDDTITLKTDDEELEFKISDMLCCREKFFTNIDSKENILISCADIKSKNTYSIKFEIKSEEKVNVKNIRLIVSKADVSGIIRIYDISSQIVWKEIFKSSKMPINPNDPFWTKFMSSLNITEVRPV